MNNKFKKQATPYLTTCSAMRAGDMQKPLAKSVNKNYKPTDKEVEILQKAEEIWLAYSQTPEGVAFTESLKTMDLPTAQRAVADLLDGPVFSVIQAMLAAAENLGLIPNSFTIAFNIQGVFGIGFIFSVGAAIGIGLSSGQKAGFVSGGLIEGLDEGFIIGVEFGLWTSAPADLGGTSLFTGVDVGLGADAAIAVSYNLSGDILGATLVVGAGEEDGADEGEVITFVFGDSSNPTPGSGFYLQPAYQDRQGKKNFMIIKNITCLDTFEVGNDEIYFGFQPDADFTYYFPTYDYYSMDDDDHPWSSWDCGRSVWFNENVNIQLYNEDSGNRSNQDALGGVTIHLSDFDANGNFVKNICNDHYQISCSLVATDVEYYEPSLETAIVEND
ncbi:MAG: hypothetical protein AB8H03_12595 [Saprospiraceae bacterium]